ncbi:MAG: hypothetical protein E7386_02270 [Ruminococcaceae bacterium]|nr:hypothetical protein [Oscillospiraceae bacterium]
MSILSLTYLYIINRVLMIAASLGILVLGVMILVNKVKQTKILGIHFIIFGVSSACSCFLTGSQRFLGVAVYARFSIIYNVINILTIFAMLFCLCWYIHKTYGKKFIYIPVFAIEIVGRAANRIVAIFLSKSLSGASAGYWITMVMNINNLITGTVTAVIIILAFYKNRDRENIIPATWKIRIVLYAFNALQFFYTISTYCFMIKLLKDRSYKPAGIFGFLFSDAPAYLIVTTFEVMTVLVNLIFPVYVLVKLKKANNKGIPEQTAEQI